MSTDKQSADSLGDQIKSDALARFEDAVARLADAFLHQLAAVDLAPEASV